MGLVYLGDLSIFSNILPNNYIGSGVYIGSTIIKAGSFHLRNTSRAHFMVTVFCRLKYNPKMRELCATWSVFCRMKNGNQKLFKYTFSGT